MNENDFLKKFENQTLPSSEFNHMGHLWLGWLYIRDYELGEAQQKLTIGIKKFAESLGAANKFHLTLTATFACAVKSRFKYNQTFEDFLKDNQDLLNCPMSLIETHYSPELLRTEKARETFVSPDREPFPLEYQMQLDKN